MTGLGATLDPVADELARALPDRVRRDVPATGLTTYRVGGSVGVVLRLGSEADATRAAGVLARHRPPVLAVGRGSNLLVADRGWPGVVVVLEGSLEDVTARPAATAVTAGGGAALPVVARRSAAAGLGGLEFLVGIPGSVGGAVRMNAGGHGRDVAEVLVAARVLDLYSAATDDRAASELGLSYRTSALGPADLVLRATFAVAPEPVEVCEARIAEIVRWRRDHQPGGANAGSVFTNPPGDSAGRLIDATGLKGLRVGGAVVSAKHANFIQAEPGATATDVVRLVAEVRRRVADATGITLEPEIRFVGFGGDTFDGADGGSES